LGLISDKLGLEGGFWSFIGEMNDNLANFGFAVVGIFLMSWLISTVLYKAKGYDSLQINRS
ncbi:HoxN/HupN/NixA family nickel/cobalt transporter, partial [Rhizobium lusitanum]|nr:HoxN/HupN/NixA family nickel/cobalt transporter [Rhizobium lusitanum]